MDSGNDKSKGEKKERRENVFQRVKIIRKEETGKPPK